MEINQYFIKLLESIKQLDELDFFMGEGRLSQSEFRLVLEVILEREKGGEIISSELARRLGITRSAVSQIVTKLEERNVIRRVASPIDRKIAYIRLSDPAVAVFNEQCKRVNAVMNKLVEDFGEDRLKALIADYDELASSFDRIRKEIDGVNESKE